MGEFNVENLIKIKVHNFTAIENIIWRKPLNILKFKILKPGYYTPKFKFLGDKFSDLNLSNNYIQSSLTNRIFKKPTVKLIYNNGEEKEYVFETYLRAKKFANKFTEEKLV